MIFVDLSKAMHILLKEDPAITAIVSQFNGNPAIFTMDVAPLGASNPLINIPGTVTEDNPRFSKQERGREIFRDINCFADKIGTDSAINDLTEAVLARVDSGLLSIPGATVVAFETVNVVALDEREALRRVVSTRLRLA